MTVTIVATPAPTDPQPRTQINITGSGADASAYFTLVRTDPGGRVRKVITEPNPRLTSGVWAGYDYHAPFNQPVTYQVTATTQATAAPVTLTSPVSWLIHRTNPALSVQIDKVMAIPDRVVASTAAAHYAFGAEFPVTRNEGARRARTGALTVQVTSAAHLAAVESLLHDSGVILMNLTLGAGVGWLDETWAWIQPGDLTFSNPGAWAFYPTRNVAFPFQIVDVPAGAIAPVWSYGTLLADSADFPTYAALPVNYHNYSNAVIDSRSV
jgi:hypothetical protein